jgi:hypothetical protein
MLKPVELALLGLGGTSLFSVCFLGFASVAGVPMHTLPVVGAFFPAPEVPEAEPPEPEEPDPTDSESLTPQRRLSNDERRMLESNIASLASWVLPPPLDAKEINDLVAELRDANSDLGRREQELELREAQIAEQMLALGQRASVLEQMRAELDSREDALEQRRLQLEQLAGTLQRTDLVRTESADRELTRKAMLFAEGDAADVASRIVAYPADEAAAILDKLEDQRAIEILQALPQDKWQEYSDAYARIGS